MGNLQNLFKQAVGSALDQRGKPAKLGRPDGTLYWVDANGMTHRTRVWARIGESQSNQEVVVDCVKVSPQVDMPVRVDYVNGVLTVVDTDGRQAVEFTGGRGGGNVAPHAWLHSRLGPDPLYIDGLQYLPLAVTPTATPDLTVTVQSGVYRDTSGDLQVFDTAVSGSLSSYVPATDYHFVIICLNRASDALVVVDGADITAEDVLFSDVVVTAADIEAVTIDATYAPLAVVLLYAGQTAVRAKDIVRDLRGANSISGGGGTPGGSDTQLQFNDGGAFGGDDGLVYNKTTDTLTIAGGLVVNGGGANADTRIESVGNANMLLVDSDQDKILIGTDTEVSSLAILETHGPSNTIAMVDTAAASGTNAVGYEYWLNNDSAPFKYVSLVAQSTSTTPGSESGRLTFAVATGGILKNLFEISGDSGFVFNTLGDDLDFTVKGDTATNLLIADAGLDTVQIGTTTAGALANIGPSEINFNNAEADIDFRIAGNGVTNGIVYNAGNNRTGFGTGSPRYNVDIVLADTSTSANDYGLFVERTTTVSAAITQQKRAMSFFSYLDGSGGGAQDVGGVLGEVWNRQTSGNLSFATAFNGAVRVTGGGNVATGYGLRVIPILTSTGNLTTWVGIDSRGPAISGAGAITTSYGVFISGQKVTGVTTGYGIFQAGTADINQFHGSIVVGSATGGSKGAGTINAQAVYDDNVLLSDHLWDLYYDGKMRPEDAKRHAGARLWTIDETAIFTNKNRHLPTLPSRDEWEGSGTQPLGSLITGLWQAVELLQMQIYELKGAKHD